MANYLNIFAGILTFIGSSALWYGLYAPFYTFITYFPTELFVICGTSVILLMFFSICYAPFIMIVSDDTGN